MTQRLRALSAAAAILLAAQTAAAADWCFNSTSPPNPAPIDDPDILVVAKHFKLPKPGDCRPINGFDVGNSDQTFPRPATGTACLDSAGAKLHVGIVIHATSGPAPINTDTVVNVHMVLPYPALTGGEVYFRRDLPFNSGMRTDGLVGPCGSKFPIP